MAINYGDRILIEDEDGECLKGAIVDVWRDKRKEITDYIVLFDSGVLVRIKPNSHWCKLDDCVYTLRKAEPVYA
ncbi:MAG: hypothetical protein JW762_03940 [Dehalococcoidales bacterium]|nr:hypothetical protein [Dehalococcoidales bacterium]